MATEQLRPWEPLPPVTCERCGRRATVRVAAGTATVEPGVVLLGTDPLTASVLTCPDCAETVAVEVCDRYGGSGSEPLRMSWRYWFFTCTRLGRPLDRLSVAWWNWRAERDL